MQVKHEIKYSITFDVEDKINYDPAETPSERINKTEFRFVFLDCGTHSLLKITVHLLGVNYTRRRNRISYTDVDRQVHEYHITTAVYNENDYKLNKYQFHLIKGITKQEITGETATGVVNTLFTDFVLDNPEFGAERFIPQQLHRHMCYKERLVHLLKDEVIENV